MPVDENTILGGVVQISAVWHWTNVEIVMFPDITVDDADSRPWARKMLMPTADEV